MDSSHDMWNTDPESLWNLSLQAFVKNLIHYTVETRDCDGDYLSLHPDFHLSPNICQATLDSHFELVGVMDDYIVHIFRDAERTRLRKANLSNSYVTDRGVGWIMRHKPTELNISRCPELYGCMDHRSRLLQSINENSENLTSLILGNSHCMFEEIDLNSLVHKEFPPAQKILGRDFVFLCPELRVFSISGLKTCRATRILQACLAPMDKLAVLDISGCRVNLSQIPALLCLSPSLTTLILYNVEINIAEDFHTLACLENLRALDLGQGRPVQYPDPELHLEMLVSHLPHLIHLDMSRTNLPGFLKPAAKTHTSLQKDSLPQEQCPIPGLEGRQFAFLGLLNCPFEPCHREKLPAKTVAGDANEDQIMAALMHYTDKAELLGYTLKNLYNILRHTEYKRQDEAIEGVLNGMRRHQNDLQIQVPGTACLFIFMKRPKRKGLPFKVKRQIIRALLDAAENSEDEELALLRNICHTLFRFQFPHDVLPEYERIVRFLLLAVQPVQPDEYLQRISLTLLNSVSCQVNGLEKRIAGDLGVISAMIKLIRGKLALRVSDVVMENAWSLMWNLTDEMPQNCLRFLDEYGLDLFMQCLKLFPQDYELLKNIMGLMGNVAEVKFLRPRMMHPPYLEAFKQLLFFSQPGIEVSYNACGVLAHMVADGSSAWTVTSPSRSEVMAAITQAIKQWDLGTRRNINYRSFAPILSLLPNFDAPQSQHWAAWALCNLTKVYTSKYCPLVEEGGGIPILQGILANARLCPDVRELVQEVVDRCRHFKEFGIPEEEEEQRMSDTE